MVTENKLEDEDMVVMLHNLARELDSLQWRQIADRFAELSKHVKKEENLIKALY